MDGVLLVDKPIGPTSHDVVRRIRRTLRQRAVGHTGTLDPLASGLLPLVLGRATRIASLLSGTRKSYDADIRLGISTDTDDAQGAVLEQSAAAVPEPAAVAAALERFRGTFEQTPPGYSAKKIGGERAYDLARQARPVDLKPVTVSVDSLELLSVHGAAVRVCLTVSAGFYVRSLARDLGQALGCGGHLTALRRTASGDFKLDGAVALDEAERLGDALAGRVLTASAALSRLPAVQVTEAGLTRARHGNMLGPEHLETRPFPAVSREGRIRVLAADGHLVALAEPRGGALHPVVVLG